VLVSGGDTNMLQGILTGMITYLCK